MSDDVHYDPLCECAFEIDHNTENNSLRTVCGFFNVPKRVHSSILKGVDQRNPTGVLCYSSRETMDGNETACKARKKATQCSYLDVS